MLHVRIFRVRPVLTLGMAFGIALLPAVTAAIAEPPGIGTGNVGSLDAEPLDIAIVADASGSETAADVAAERLAANLIINAELSPSSRVTVYEFGSSNGPGQAAVTELCPPTAVGEPVAAAQMAACVNKLVPRTAGNDTDHAAALRQAITQLALQPPPGTPRHRLVFLLTDGVLDVHNSPSYGPDPAQRNAEADRQLREEVLPEARTNHVQIWPLGFGQADSAALQAFAAGGAGANSLCATNPDASPRAQVVTDPASVATTALQAFAAARCAHMGQPVIGTGTLTVTIPPIATAGSITVTTVTDAQQITFKDPDGQQVTTDGTQDGSTFRLRHTGTIQSLHISDPKPGKWTVHIATPPGVAATPATASVVWQGALRTSVVVVPAAPTPGKRAVVEVRLQRRNGVVFGHDALAGLTFGAQLSGSGFAGTLPIPLRDDGRDGDRSADDGVFTGAVIVPQSADGDLKFLATVAGPGIAADKRPWATRIASPDGALGVDVRVPGATVHPGSTVRSTIQVVNPGAPTTLQVRLADLPPDARLELVSDPRLLVPAGTSRFSVALLVPKAAPETRPGGRLVVTDASNHELGSAFVSFNVRKPPPWWDPWAYWAAAALAAAGIIAAFVVTTRRRARRVRHLAVLFAPTAGGSATAGAPNRGQVFGVQISDGHTATPRLVTVQQPGTNAVTIRRIPPKVSVTAPGVGRRVVALGEPIALPEGDLVVFDSRRPTPRVPRQREDASEDVLGTPDTFEKHTATNRTERSTGTPSAGAEEDLL